MAFVVVCSEVVGSNVLDVNKPVTLADVVAAVSSERAALLLSDVAWITLVVLFREDSVVEKDFVVNGNLPVVEVEVIGVLGWKDCFM